MKDLKKVKMLSKKTISIIIASLVVITGAMYNGVNAYKKSNEEVEFTAREREYMVTKGNITAGAKGAGSLKFEDVKHNFNEPVVIGEIFVNVGEEVKKGDKLVSISDKYLTEKSEELNKSLREANAALEQAKGNKRTTVLNNDKAWDDKVQVSQSNYDRQKREITENVNRLNGKITDIGAQLEDINRKIEELVGKGEEELVKLDELKLTQSTLLTEKSSLEGQLDTYKKSLANLDSDRQKELEVEANDRNTNNEISNISISGLDLAISNAEDAVNKAQEEIDKINKLKESPILHSEVDGIVSSITGAAGDTTIAEGSIVNIGESSKVIAELTVSQSDIVNIQEGQDVSLEIATYQDEKFRGTVKFVNLKPNSQGNSATYTAIVNLEPTEYKLLEGMSVTAQFIIKEVKDVLMISNKAIILKDGKQFVKLKNEDGTTTEVNIQTGFSDGKNTEIINGLKENDTVVIGG